jgi:hypothetical protein
LARWPEETMPRVVELAYRKHVRAVLKNDSVRGVTNLMHFDIRAFIDVYVAIRSLEGEAVGRRDGLSLSDRKVTSTDNVKSRTAINHP